MFTLSCKLRFRKLKLTDINWVQALIRADGGMGCQYSFASMFLWQDIYKTAYCEYKNSLIRKSDETDSYISYHYPIGEKNDRIAAAAFIIKNAFRARKSVHFYGLYDETLKELQELYNGSTVSFELVRDNQNYIILSENIIKLEGSKYSKHRRYLARFEEYTNWNWEIITRNNAASCISFNRQWYLSQEKSVAKEQELIVTNKALTLMDELKLQGCLLKLDGEIIGFEIGEPITQNMFASHFQKARREIVGAYQMLYNLFAKAFCNQYTYLNIEEDMGEPGLRNAKLSWKPEYLSNYYTAILSPQGLPIKGHDAPGMAHAE